MSNKDAVRKVLDAVKAEKRTSLTAPEGKLVCDAYGIPVPKEGVAKSAAEAGKLAGGMGFPVVMKIVSPDILHKTEAGGVVVGVLGSVVGVRGGGRAGGPARAAEPAPAADRGGQRGRERLPGVDDAGERVPPRAVG